jgi:hypothetical protein
VSSSAAMPRQTLPLAWPGRMGITCRSQQEELTLRA